MYMAYSSEQLRIPSALRTGHRVSDYILSCLSEWLPEWLPKWLPKWLLVLLKRE